MKHVLLLWIIGFVIVILKWNPIDVWLSAFCGAMISYKVLRTEGVNSLPTFFLLFYLLYAYSVPISLSLHLELYGNFKIDDSYYVYLLANHIALLGLILGFKKSLEKKSNIKRKHFKPNLFIKSAEVYYLSLISGIIASVFEFVNFIRVGGIIGLLKGKAFYQSAVSDMSLTLPSDGFFLISIGLLGVYIGLNQTDYKRFKIWLTIITVNAFYVFIQMTMGERGNILVALISFIIGFGFYVRFYTIKIWYILAMFFLLFLMVYMTIFRNYKEFNNDASFFHFNEVLHSTTSYTKLVNPANIEFGAAMHNFLTYTEDESNAKLFFGKTYFHFIVRYLPKSIYKGDRRASVIQFRDKYHRNWAIKGSNSGTGYSSLMEAFMNFSYLGGFIVFFLFSRLLVFFEGFKDKKIGPYGIILYLLLFNIVMIFCRTAADYMTETFLFYVMEITLLLLVGNFIFKIPMKANLTIKYKTNDE